MKCPKCNSDNVAVVDSRERPDGKRRRRYLCKDCNSRFSTLEVTVEELKKLLDYLKQGEAIRGAAIHLNELIDKIPTLGGK
jgi:transcriptional regulator NrdR family protein